jgi:hypothetical protein
MTEQRMLDPVHGLIKFDLTPNEQQIFKLINCPEFQRLRRIRQLGFSEFVYPGATHTRFSHSIGVFHNARRLLEIIKAKSNDYDEERASIALCAALLHDLGHGPFSHTFESVERSRGVEKDHEAWTSDIINGHTQIRESLAELGENFPAEVGKIISGSEGADIYASVVSSQFDADRLDYLKRDKYMTGIGSGDFDMEWILDCLEVGSVTIGGTGDEDYVEAPAFYVNYKGFKAAEAYLQARFQMYSMVYMHKTTRGAEKMLEAMLKRLSELLIEIGHEKLGVSKNNLLLNYILAENPDLEQYLALDDNVIWSFLEELKSCKDEHIAALSRGLLERKLYKCFDVGVRAGANSGHLMNFKKALREQAENLGLVLGLTLLEDNPRIDAYKWYDWESENALKKVLVNANNKEQKENIVDIAGESAIVQALEKENIYRIYVPNNEDREKVSALWTEVTQ